MQKIGIINNREILYLNVRQDKNWGEKLPIKNWCVFTIANNNDSELIDDAISKCLDNFVIYTCSVGQLASATELAFDLEVTKRAIEKEEKEDKIGKIHDYDKLPVTTMHQDFSEGFWFSTKFAYNNIQIKKVVCLDFTIKGVKQHLTELVNKINEGWLPSEEETEELKYDK